MGSFQYDLDVLVIGAGFSGIYQLHHHRKLGHSVKVFEAGSELGGVWYWNRYPGARVDIPVPMYELSMEDLWKDWNWSERYPSQQELYNYFQYVDSKLGLKKDICFNTRVTSAHFNDSEDRWIIQAENGIVARARFLVTCLGFGSKPFYPKLKGLETFQGSCHHTARWPRGGLDIKGKRVGVIGTGASGVQIVQTIAPEVAHLTVFQRTPNIALPMRQTPLDEATQAKEKANYPALYRRRRQTPIGIHYDRYPKNLFDATPEERLLHFEDLWKIGGMSFLFANFQDVLLNPEANEEIYAFWREKVRERVKSPELQEKLAPSISVHPVGAKRCSLEQNYYEVFNQPNVDLVDIQSSPIAEITPNGVRTEDGTEYELDVIVLATGFDSVTGGINQIDIRGPEGTSIAEKWAQGVHAYLGMACSGFPNLFFVFGPQGPTAVCNGPACAETEGDWIINCIRHMMVSGLNRIEATREAEVEWRREVMEEASKRLISKAKSWYMGANVPGKPIEILMYTGGAAKYTRMCIEIAERGYEGFSLS